MALIDFLLVTIKHFLLGVLALALRVDIDWKWLFLKWPSQFGSKF